MSMLPTQTSSSPLGSASCSSLIKSLVFIRNPPVPKVDHILREIPTIPSTGFLCARPASRSGRSSARFPPAMRRKPLRRLRRIRLRWHSRIRLRRFAPEAIVREHSALFLPERHGRHGGQTDAEVRFIEYLMADVIGAQFFDDAEERLLIGHTNGDT